jgi:colicin import membrane protein
VAQVEQTA